VGVWDGLAERHKSLVARLRPAHLDSHHAHAHASPRLTSPHLPDPAPPRRSDRPLQIVGRGDMQVQERGPGFRQQPFKNSDRPEEALSGSAKETRWDARWEPPQGWSHPRTCGRPPDCSAAPATNPRLSDFPSQSAHASASASARTNDHLYCTVLSPPRFKAPSRDW
jgi:hypothetical protein